jgi:hypothetical protein
MEFGTHYDNYAFASASRRAGMINAPCLVPIDSIRQFVNGCVCFPHCQVGPRRLRISLIHESWKGNPWVQFNSGGI